MQRHGLYAKSHTRPIHVKIDVNHVKSWQLAMGLTVKFMWTYAHQSTYSGTLFQSTISSLALLLSIRPNLHLTTRSSLVMQDQIQTPNRSINESKDITSRPGLTVRICTLAACLAPARPMGVKYRLERCPSARYKYYPTSSEVSDSVASDLPKSYTPSRTSLHDRQSTLHIQSAIQPSI